ncbi:MAG: helix-turn-helix domain-containing protein [Pseudorhizobium sp.]
MIQITPDGRLTRTEAAKFLGFSPKTLAEWHRLGYGPPSFLVGGRRFYRLAELESYASGATPIRPPDSGARSGARK